MSGNRAENVGHPCPIAHKPHCSGPESPWEANKALKKECRPVKVPTYSDFLCPSYNQKADKFTETRVVRKPITSRCSYFVYNSFLCKTSRTVDKIEIKATIFWFFIKRGWLIVVECTVLFNFHEGMYIYHFKVCLRIAFLSVRIHSVILTNQSITLYQGHMTPLFQKWSLLFLQQRWWHMIMTKNKFHYSSS